jgi:hypothetical protein
MDREDDAKKRLALLHQPIPRPTKAAVAQNRREEESRQEASTYNRLISVVKKGPDVAQAAKVGDPTLVDPTPVAANQDAGATAMRAMGISRGGNNGVSVETVNSGTPAANEPAPRSDAPPPPPADPFAHAATANAPDPNELTPAPPPVASKPDPNDLTPAADAQTAAASNQPLPPPVQVNELQQGQPSSSSATANAASSSSLASDQDVSSSKKKKKKGLKKIISF